MNYFFFCGRETCSFTLKEEHVLGVIENRVLRKIFGSLRAKSEETGKKLREQEMHNLYSSPHILSLKMTN